MTIIFPLALLLTQLPQLIHAQCPVAGPFIFPFVFGTCNSDPSNPANLAIRYSPGSTWDDDTVVNGVISYRDSNNLGHRVTGFPQSIFRSNAENTVTFSYPVALTDIPHGALVSQTILVTGTDSACFWSGRLTHTQNHFPTATSTDTTTTVTVTDGALATTTSTLEEVFTATETPATVTATSITGYKTIWAKRVTATKTSTITPKPITKWSLSIAKTTTTVTCLPGPRKRDATHLERRARNAVGLQEEGVEVELKKRQNVVYEEPNCGFWTTTTVYTDTVIVLATTTTTDTLTSFETTTTTTTSTAPTPTSYTSVRGTTTLTPTWTRARWSILPPVRTTKVKVITVTVKKFPGGKWPKKCTSTKPNNPPGPVCKPTLVP